MAKNPAPIKRAYSRPSLTKLVVLNSEMSIQAFEKYVKRTMAALYRLDVILFFIGSEELAEKANKEVNLELKELLAKQVNEHRKLQEIAARVEAEDDELIEPDWPDQRSQEFKIYSPLCALYLKVLAKFEANQVLMKKLWLNGEYDSNLKHKKLKSMSIHLRNVSHHIINHSRLTMEVARNEGKTKDVEMSIHAMGFEKDDGEKVLTPREAKAEQQKADKEALQAENDAMMGQSFDDALAQAEAKKSGKAEAAVTA